MLFEDQHICSNNIVLLHLSNLGYLQHPGFFLCFFLFLCFFFFFGFFLFCLFLFVFFFFAFNRWCREEGQRKARVANFDLHVCCGVVLCLRKICPPSVFILIMWVGRVGRVGVVGSAVYTPKKKKKKKKSSQ